jgi:sugar transferase (PEP-CTERM system associated)
LLGSAVLRLVFSRVSDGQAFKKLVLVYGSGPRAASFQALRRASDRRGFTLLGYVCPPEDPCLVPLAQVLDASAGLLSLCDRLTVDDVVIALEDRRLSLPVDELLTCRLAGIEVVDYVSFMERETGRIVLEALNPSWMIFGEGFRRGTLRTVTSRLLDILASLLILTITLPLIALVAAAIWLEDGRKGGGVLYRQVRIGQHGQPFTLYKFRSMRANAEVAGKAQWAQRNDPRVTRLGGFLRKARIDELPQLFNVLRGDMSLVGPRPERPQFVEQLTQSIPFYAHRHAVKPGIAGWAQLCYPYGASEADALQKLQYDLYYVKNNSFLLDLAILLQTAEVVLMGKGAR